MNLTDQLKEALGKPDAKKQAEQLKQFLSKSGHKKGSKEEQAEIKKWLDSKDFEDKDASKITGMLESVNEAKKEDLKILQAEVEGLLKDKKFDFNKDFKAFHVEAVRRAEEKGATKIISYDVMDILDKVIK